MISFIKNIFCNPTRLILTIILLATLILHLPGSFYGFPLRNTYGDEITIMGTIFKMLNDHTLRPDYPSFYHLPILIYIQLPFYIVFLLSLRLSGLFSSLADLKDFVLSNYSYFLPFARMLSAIFAAVSVWLIYRLSKKIFKNERAALLAGFLLAFNFMFFQVTHSARAWPSQVMMLLIAAYVYFWFFEKDKPTLKDYILVGVVSGLSAGFHLVGIFIFVVFLTLFWVKDGGGIFRLNSPGYWQKYRRFFLLPVIILSFIGLYYCLHPYGVLLYLTQSGVEKTEQGLEWSFLGNFWFYTKIFFNYETLLAILFVPSLIWLWRRQKTAMLALMSFPVVLAGSIAYAVHAEPRFIIATMPFVILPVAYFAEVMISRLKSRWGRLLIYGAVGAAVLYLPLLWASKMMGENTLTLTYRWFSNTVPANSRVVNNNFYFNLPENKEAAQAMRLTKSNWDTVERKFVSQADNFKLAQPRFFFITARRWEYLDSYEIEKPIKFDYLILSFWDRKGQAEAMEAFPVSKTLVQKFYPTPAVVDLTDVGNNVLRPFWTLGQVQMTGPYVEIYKLIK
jgi:hypothetical protein